MRTLFTPVQLGDLALENRIVMAPMTRNRAAEDGTPTDLMAEYYQQRASAGMIVTEMTVVSAQGNAYVHAPGLYTPQHVEGWRKVTDAVHEAGGVIVVQLAHGGRISHPLLQPNGELPVAPSAVRPAGHSYTKEGKQDHVTPRALETSELPGIVEQFRRAAALAREAGFDGVELHAANGYLLDQFLRDATNKRTDEYGGSALNRARLLVEVAHAVAGVFSPGRVGVRVSPFNPYNDISDSDPVATFHTVASALAPLSLAFLHVVEPVENGAPAGLTGKLREAFGGAAIANSGHTETTANAMLNAGQADAVSFGAAFLANPDLPARLAAGAPLNTPDPSTFFMGGARGYVDYPAMVGLAGLNAPLQAEARPTGAA